MHKARTRLSRYISNICERVTIASIVRRCVPAVVLDCLIVLNISLSSVSHSLRLHHDIATQRREFHSSLYRHQHRRRRMQSPHYCIIDDIRWHRIDLLAHSLSTDAAAHRCAAQSDMLSAAAERKVKSRTSTKEIRETIEGTTRRCDAHLQGPRKTEKSNVLTKKAPVQKRHFM